MPKSKISLLVEGGKATAGPPLGPAIAPMGINVVQVVNQINEKTKAYSGIQVPIIVLVDGSNKTFEVEVGSPPTSALIKKELGLALGAKGEAGKGQEKVGDLKLEQATGIAKTKNENMMVKSLPAAVKQVLGTCVSMGITVDGKDPREVIRQIDSGEVKI